MKKLTPKRKRWLLVRQRREERRRSGRQRGIIADAAQASGKWRSISIYLPNQGPRRGLGRAIPMPKILCFDKNADGTLAACEEIRAQLAEIRRRDRSGVKRRPYRRMMYSALESVEEISPSAALVLASEYERTYQLRGTVPSLVNLEKWHSDVVSTLNGLGFFQQFGFGQAHGEDSQQDDNQRSFDVLPMRSGNSADPIAVNALINDLKQLYPVGDASSEAALLHLYGAMVEAIVNVVRHAYPPGGVYEYQPINRWWMVGAVDRKGRRTMAVVYDQGVTIPVSLPNWEHYAGVLRRLSSMFGMVPSSGDPRSDGHAISAAVEESVSSTGAAHRGQGLAQMRDFVNQCRGGYLKIMSRYGEVTFRPGDNPVVHAHKTSVGGTLIEWNVLL
jgi:hypothetical protein